MNQKTRKDLTNQKFGLLTVISYYGFKHGRPHWNCLCECGNVTYSSSKNLLSGASQSCGCARITATKLTNTKHGFSVRGKEHPLYKIWNGIKRRCYNKKDKSYPDYGGRGIKVCERWLHSFENFLTDMGERPEGMSIERKTIIRITKKIIVNGQLELNKIIIVDIILLLNLMGLSSQWLN